MSDDFKFIIIVIILVLIFKAGGFICDIKFKSKNNNETPNVSINTINYPSQVICDKCNVNVFPTRKNIDSSTWDLKCSCGNIAYKHPKREERIEQIKNLLN